MCNDTFVHIRAILHGRYHSMTIMLHVVNKINKNCWNYFFTLSSYFFISSPSPPSICLSPQWQCPSATASSRRRRHFSLSPSPLPCRLFHYSILPTHPREVPLRVPLLVGNCKHHHQQCAIACRAPNALIHIRPKCIANKKKISYYQCV